MKENNENKQKATTLVADLRKNLQKHKKVIKKRLLRPKYLKQFTGENKLMAAAKLAEDAKNQELLKTSYLKAIEEFNSPTAMHHLGWILLGEGNLAEAELWFRKCIKLSQNQDARYGLAAVLYKSGKEEEAVKNLIKIAQYPYNDKRAMIDLIKYYLQVENYIDAKIWLEQYASNMKEQMPESYVSAMIEMARHAKDDAELKKWLKIKASPPYNARRALIEYLTIINDAIKKIKNIEDRKPLYREQIKWIESLEKIPANIYLWLASVYEELKKYPEAEYWYNKAAQDPLDYFEAKRSIAQLYYRCNEVSQAEQICLDLIANPANVGDDLKLDYSFLALIYAEHNEYSAACKAKMQILCDPRVYSSEGEYDTNQLEVSKWIVRLFKSQYKGGNIKWEEFDAFLKQSIPLDQLLYVISSQNYLIKDLLEFCKTQTINNEKIFDLFPNEKIDSEKYQDEIDRFSSGICLGLSGLFLQTAFITDMQAEKTSIQGENDLYWFCKCALLLQDATQGLPDDIKRELATFISMGLHLHNKFESDNFEPRVFMAHEKDFSPVHHQALNIVMGDFTGERKIDFKLTTESMNYNSLDKLQNLLTVDGPAYFMLDVYLNIESGHAMAMHKDANGTYTFYDPSYGIQQVQLASMEDINNFYRKNLLRIFDEESQNPLIELFVSIGVPENKHKPKNINKY